MEKFINGGTSSVLVDAEKGYCIKKVVSYLEFDIVPRELYWLNELASFDRTPNVLKFNDSEKIITTNYCGEPLTKKNLPHDWEDQLKYIYNNLKTNKCCHNDIKPTDLLVKDGKIMLVDFGWATRSGESIPSHWPKGLGFDYAYGQHDFNDLYSLMKSIFMICNPKQQQSLCETPNMHTDPPKLEFQSDGCIVSGYQKYFINDHRISPIGGNSTNPKISALMDYFQNCFFKNKSFLDLGAANGFFSFCALAGGANSVTAVDIDEGHLEIIQQVQKLYGISGISIVNRNISDFSEPADVVFALALIHWIYSCTEVFGSLSSAITFLRNLTKESLFIEWIDPSDGAIDFFKHIEFNRDFISEPYNKDYFIAALDENFVETKKIADISPTRQVYLCKT